MKMFGSWTELVKVVFRLSGNAITLRENQGTPYTADRDVQLPPEDANGVLVSATSTQTLTNKTLTSPQVVTQIQLNAQAPAKFLNAGGTHFTALRAANPSVDTTFQLPVADGTANQVLQTDGSGNLSFASVATTALNQFNVPVGDSTNTAIPTETDLLGDIRAATSSSTVTITNATPAVVTWASHGLRLGQTVYFTTTGTLPTGLSPSTTYYTTSVTTNTFSLSLTIAGAEIATSSAGSGVHTGHAGGFEINSSTQRDYIVLDTGNGTGSSLTGVRRFSNIRLPAAGLPAFTYTDSASNGGSILVNTPGLYSIHYCDRNDTVGMDFAISLNSSATPTGNAGTVLAIETASATSWVSISTLVYLYAGDVLRAVNSGGGSLSTAAPVQLRLFRVM